MRSSQLIPSFVEYIDVFPYERPLVTMKSASFVTVFLLVGCALTATSAHASESHDAAASTSASNVDGIETDKVKITQTHGDARCDPIKINENDPKRGTIKCKDVPYRALPGDGVNLFLPTDEYAVTVHRDSGKRNDIPVKAYKRDYAYMQVGTPKVFGDHNPQTFSGGNDEILQAHTKGWNVGADAFGFIFDWDNWVLENSVNVIFDISRTTHGHNATTIGTNNCSQSSVSPDKNKTTWKCVISYTGSGSDKDGSFSFPDRRYSVNVKNVGTPMVNAVELTKDGARKGYHSIHSQKSQDGIVGKMAASVHAGWGLTVCLPNAQQGPTGNIEVEVTYNPLR